MARVVLTRHVAADPASVALLLAEPAAPGISLTPPRRTGVGFTAGIELSDSLDQAAVGDITVEPASEAGSVLRLVLGAEAGSSRIERVGATFLSALALRARSRSYAA